jgi:hypothetical protein
VARRTNREHRMLTLALGREPRAMRLTILLVFLSISATSCTSQRDYDQVLAESLKFSERPNTPIRTIVLASSLSVAARKSAMALRPVIDQSALPNGAEEVPSDYFILSSISFSGGMAHVKGVHGPTQNYPPLCGTTYDFSYNRVGWRWKAGDIESIVC